MKTITEGNKIVGLIVSKNSQFTLKKVIILGL